MAIPVLLAVAYAALYAGVDVQSPGGCLPKRSCFRELTQRPCNPIEREVNDRPRKILGFSTPSEAEIEACCA